VGVQEGGKVILELLAGVVVISTDSGLLERAVHPLDLALDPGVAGRVDLLGDGFDQGARKQQRS
jgi:hypothetical protein